ncbi:MAG TPA: xanthine dehydrogenase family protein subunit M [Frankiaceae bacterium]|jgi:carbon-monoxide dehydrogenase medium subunit|nr:xanthine dehydrogenase family protein subunit M [Frankiaceae bacterium]
MKPAAFDYHRPASAEEAVQMLAEYGDSAKVLAGGQSLVPMLTLRLAAFEHLIDIGRLAPLQGIERRAGGVRIGAMTTQAAIERSTLVADAIPLVARATPFIGHFQIRNRGTIGGSCAHADPAAEYPAVLLALEAEFEVMSATGRRVVQAAEFFAGLWTTVLADDELLTAVNVPVWEGRCGFAIEEFARRHGDFAIAGAAVALQLGDDDRVRRCHVALLGLGMTPERAAEAERALNGIRVDEVDPDEIGRLAMEPLESIPSDVHGSAGYRRQVGASVVAKAWRAAAKEARGE